MTHETEYDVILETTAVIDLRGIFDYITDVLKAPEAAERVYWSIKKHQNFFPQIFFNNKA